MNKMYIVVTTFSHEIDIDQCTKTSTSISHHINIIKRKISLKQLFTKKYQGKRFCPALTPGQGRAGLKTKTSPCPGAGQGRAQGRAGQPCPVTVSGLYRVLKFRLIL